MWGLWLIVCWVLFPFTENAKSHFPWWIHPETNERKSKHFCKDFSIIQTLLCGFHLLWCMMPLVLWRCSQRNDSSLYLRVARCTEWSGPCLAAVFRLPLSFRLSWKQRRDELCFSAVRWIPDWLSFKEQQCTSCCTLISVEWSPICGRALWPFLTVWSAYDYKAVCH